MTVMDRYIIPGAILGVAFAGGFIAGLIWGMLS